MKRGLLITVTTLLLAACPGGSDVKRPSTYADGGGSPAKYDTGGGVIYRDGKATPTGDGGGSVAPGTGTCIDIVGCAFQCQDAACVSGCSAKGTTAAQSTFTAMDTCEQGAMKAACASQCASQSTACATCLEGSCKSQYTACGMTLTCTQIDDCMAACTETDAACYDTCFNKGTPSAQALNNDLYSCFDTQAAGACKTSCSDPQSQGCFTCVQPKCATQDKACGY